ncbi:MAG TPA: hypothetical protein VJ654_14865 [Noviherbaspirillum sp.]|nr:hypothetical protein [Noviherbaspirillum sp.]
MIKRPIAAADMAYEQDWHTEEYKGMEVHVSALPRDDAWSSWDYTVRVTQPGEDAGSQSELAAQSGDDADYPSEEAALEAGFVKGYALVDDLLK